MANPSMQPGQSATFAPGTMCDRRVWEPVWRELGLTAQPGYIPVEAQLTRHAIREAFDRATKDGPVDLIGFSMGGYLSMEYALDHPERVRSLVVVCSSAYGLSDTEKRERRKVISFLETHVYRGISESRANLFVHPGRQSDPNVVGVIREMDRDLGQSVLLAQMRETSERASLVPRLCDLTCPVLLVGAEMDRLVQITQVEKMHGLLPDSRFERATDAGHMLPLEQPAWLAERIANFLESI